jgi:hypothetical protein
VRPTAARVARWVDAGMLYEADAASVRLGGHRERLGLLRRARRDGRRILRDLDEEEAGRQVWANMELERDDALLLALSQTVPRRPDEPTEAYAARLRGVYASFRVRLDPSPQTIVVSAGTDVRTRAGSVKPHLPVAANPLDLSPAANAVSPMEATEPRPPWRRATAPTLLVLTRKQKSVVNKALARDGVGHPTTAQFAERAAALNAAGKL